MMWKSHASTGWLGGAGAAWLYTPSPAIRITLGLVTAGWAIWPDADHPNSKFTRSLPPVTTLLSRLIRGFSRIVYLLTRTEKDRKVAGRHRMITHTFWWAIFTGGITFWFCDWRSLPTTVGVLAAVTSWLGCCIHCAGDDLTESGVPFWAPLIKINGQRWYRVHLLPEKLRFTTNTGVETFLYRAVFLPGSVLLFPGVSPVVGRVLAGAWHLASPHLPHP
jgi:membrane-bound metal-dependent hydrolase YbcI (DUF457 family)